MEQISNNLGRRERQIVDAVYRLGKASVAQVRAELPDPPSYSAVRAMLNLLEGKGYLKHQRDGLRYVYLPAIAPQKARQSALRHLVSTFFQGSPAAAAAALLELPGAKLSPEDRARLNELIARAEKEGR
jgi:BlaI family transcriptional regulator, penicillinase repressor